MLLDVMREDQMNGEGPGKAVSWRRRFCKVLAAVLPGNRCQLK
jgi:hypothetical protein